MLFGKKPQPVKPTVEPARSPARPAAGLAANPVAAQQAKPAAKPARQVAAQPRTKEEAIRQMVADDPEKAAAILREILNTKH